MAKNIKLRHGKWLEEKPGVSEPLWICSICRNAFYFDEGTPKDNLYFYCPNCGAKNEQEVRDNGKII